MDARNEMLTLIAPLHIDSTTELIGHNKYGWGFWRFLQKIIPLPDLLPPGQVSVEEQLKERRKFPIEEWQDFQPIERVEQILQIVGENLAWPNHHFIPDDPLKMALISRDGMLVEWMEEDIESGLHITFPDLIRRNACRMNMGEFVMALGCKKNAK